MNNQIEFNLRLKRLHIGHVKIFTFNTYYVHNRAKLIINKRWIWWRRSITVYSFLYFFPFLFHNPERSPEQEEHVGCARISALRMCIHIGEKETRRDVERWNVVRHWVGWMRQQKKNSLWNLPSSFLERGIRHVGGSSFFFFFAVCGQWVVAREQCRGEDKWRELLDGTMDPERTRDEHGRCTSSEH